MLEGFDGNALYQPHEKWKAALQVPDEESIVHVRDKLGALLALEAAIRSADKGNAGKVKDKHAEPVSHLQRTLLAALLNDVGKLLDETNRALLQVIGDGWGKGTADLSPSVTMVSDIAKLEHAVASDVVVPRGFDTHALGTVDDVDCVDCVEADFVGTDLDHGPVLVVERFDGLGSTAGHVHKEGGQAASLAE